MASASYTMVIPVDQAVAILDAIRELTSPDQIEQLSEQPLAEALARLEEIQTLACDALEHVRLTHGVRTGDEFDPRTGRLPGETGRAGRGQRQPHDVQRERAVNDEDRVPDVLASDGRETRQANQRPFAVHDSQSVEVSIGPPIVRVAAPPQNPLGGLMDEQHWLD